MKDTDDDSRKPLNERIDRFWQERGRTQSSDTKHVTMLMSHHRYFQYIHDAEIRYLEQIFKRLPRRARVLDVGCGTGRLALAIAGNCSEVVATDTSGSLLELARQAAESARISNVVFIEQRAADALPDSEAKFDVVLISGVFNCLMEEEVQASLSRVTRALKPGGLLYIRNNASNAESFERHTDESPAFVRSNEDYKTLLAVEDQLELIEDRYLFAPLCLPNSVYYHVLPKSVRDGKLTTVVLDRWFQLEQMTSDWRVRHFSRQYGAIMTLLKKPTSFQTLLAVRK